MSHRRKKLTALILCAGILANLLSGCFYDDDPVAADPEATSTPEPENTWTHVSVSAGDGLFALNYDPDSSFNPLTGSNSYNMLIASLVYEGLFTVDGNFEAHPVLCEDYGTDDGKTWKFSVKPVACHNGESLAPSDAAYSISRAKNSEKYAERLDCIYSIGYDDSANELTVVLNYPNYDFPKLLDVPIVPYGAYDSEIPAGTGPYVITDTNSGKCLAAFSDYRDRASLPIDYIYMKACGSDDLVSAFETHEIDLITQDPCGTTEYSFGGSYETRYYDTSVMQYVGFNMSDPVLQDPQIRRAISYGINREEIASDIFSQHAQPAYLAVSSSAFGYDGTLAEQYKYSKQKLTDIFVSLGMADENNDGFLEYPIYGTASTFSIDFIVNDDNRYKVEAAERIAASLKSVGLNINLRVLSWESYISALNTGNFDMYYAEVKLTSDFDLGEILTGELNYGGVYDSQYLTLIRQLQATSPEGEPEDGQTPEDGQMPEETPTPEGDGESLDDGQDGGRTADPEQDGAVPGAARQQAAYELYSYIAERAPIVPIVFKQEAVLTHRGVVSGIEPSQSNVFYGITGWTINLA